MPLEAKVLQQLVETFKTELDERLQAITDGLFLLEKKKLKKADLKPTIEEIFRAAHNIKGAARNLGISDVGAIAHAIESIFTSIKEKKTSISAEIINLCLLSVDAMHSAMQSFCDKEALSFDLDALLDQLQTGKPAASEAFPKIPKKAKKDKKDTQESHEYETIRVPIHQVDRISALIEQMQINKIGIDDQYTSLIHLEKKCLQLSRLKRADPEALAEIHYSMHQLCKSMHHSVNELGMITNSLQENTGTLRLVPASTLLRQLTRSMRDLAHEMNKQIEFEISGDQVKLDKLILEGLKDPLIHLLRNAIDHGIESPEIRKKQGKPEVGLISLEVIDEGNHILIKVTDDGGGIDYKKVAEFAQKRKLITKASLEGMKEASILELIFQPECSTKDIITDISGRGIGLDVVKSNITGLKGTVDFSTEVGRGTTFQLHLPLTLSSDIGLTIKSGGQFFILPVSSVERVVRIAPKELREVEACQVILLKDKTVPLCILSDLLDRPKQELSPTDNLSLVILSKGWDKIALLVDEIVGEREIVVKPLHPPLLNIPCVAGGTLSGTGEIIIVLNPKDLIQSAMHSNKGSTLSLQTEQQALESPKHHILLVEDSITTRTLEKNILESNDYKVSTAVDGKEAWELLQQESFSLVITDIEMPHMNGFELTERIKKSEKYQRIPVIIVTSLGTENQKKRGIEAGADAYIVKRDFESTELLDIVGQLI